MTTEFNIQLPDDALEEIALTRTWQRSGIFSKEKAEGEIKRIFLENAKHFWTTTHEDSNLIEVEFG